MQIQAIWDFFLRNQDKNSDLRVRLVALRQMLVGGLLRQKNRTMEKRYMDKNKVSKQKAMPLTNRAKCQSLTTSCEPDVNHLSTLCELSTKGWKSSDWMDYLRRQEESFDDKTEQTLDEYHQAEELSNEDYVAALFGVLQEDDPIKSRKIEGIISKLSPRKEQIVRMKYWHRMSNSDISRTLSISRQAVRVHLEKATANLKDLLEAVTKEEENKLIIDTYLENTKKQ